MASPFFQNVQRCILVLAIAIPGVVAVADRPVGVDIQDVRPVLREVAQRVCSARELEEFDQSQNQDRFFTRIWVAKESYGKMTGTGVLCELQNDH